VSAFPTFLTPSPRGAKAALMLIPRTAVFALILISKIEDHERTSIHNRGIWVGPKTKSNVRKTHLLGGAHLRQVTLLQTFSTGDGQCEINVMDGTVIEKVPSLDFQVF